MSYPWQKMNVVPMADLEGWHMAEDGVSANNLCKDYSGHGRDLACSSSGAPVLTTNALNGVSAWNFSGTSIPLVNGTPITLKHAFVVASVNETTFSALRGLLTDSTSVALLVGTTSTNKFFDFSGSYTSEYRNSDVVYAANAQLAPMNAFAIIEVQIPAGVSMDATQIGQDRADTARRHKGYFAEDLLYSAIKTPLERLKIYRYFAMKYFLWKKNAAGLYVFPFPADKVVSRERDEEHYLSEPYSGDPKALIRGSLKRSFSLPYTLRLQQEFDAAEAFHAQHYPLNHFVLRDYRFNPERDYEVRMNSSLKEQGSNVTYRFNYTYDAIET